MNKIIILCGALLMAILVSGCQYLNPPQPKTEILCEEWKAAVDNSSDVQTNR